MANLLFTLRGVRGRSMEVYDNKCIIKTEASIKTVLTSNFTDGEKTIFFIDCVGIQFKRSGSSLGYLQIETPSTHYHEQTGNLFSENTFLFENGVNGLTNDLMTAVYRFISERVEGYKYGTNTEPLTRMPPYLMAFSPRK